MGRKMKPTAVEITSWAPCREVVYKCTNCGQDFRMFGDKERFCHNCGVKVDWKVLKRLSFSFNKNDYECEKALIASINRHQLG